VPNRYDPERAPDPEAWLQPDEDERIRLVEKQHRIARELAPNLRAHALGSVLAEHMFELMQTGAQDDPAVIQARYEKAFEKLSAASWCTR
jgi:hypothetical protein